MAQMSPYHFAIRTSDHHLPGFCDFPGGDGRLLRVLQMERIWSTHRLHRATKLPGDLEGRRVPGRIEAQRLHRRNVFNLARARRGRDRAHAQSPHALTLPDSRVEDRKSV